MALDPAKQQHPLARWAEWGISIVNGFWGDYLADRGNGLAVEMAFYAGGRPLNPAAGQLASAIPQPTAKLCILVHGLSCSESVWSFDLPAGSAPETTRRVDYGSLLQTDGGYTPFYLRYNTGLAIAQNGQALSVLIQSLLDGYPRAVDEIILIGHSMGGLVLRSACHYAGEQQARWVQQVSHVFYLGTPHDGANLERFVYQAAGTLQAVPNSITRLVGKALDLRSRGIKDLRQGVLLDPHEAAPWLPHARHHLVGGTWHDDPEHIASVVLGDGLVVAQSAPPEALASANIRIFAGMRHLQLAHDYAVYRQILAWLQVEE